MINKIIIPGRIQTDTSVAIFLLNKFGKEKFSGIENAKIEIKALEELEKKEDEILLDVGGGDLDHHGKDQTTTCSKLVAENLKVDNNPSILKMLGLAERCDIYGKGIISEDVIDKAFGIPGLLVSLNRKFNNDPNRVFKTIEPVLEAHYEDERHRNEELPNELKKKQEAGEVVSFEILQRNKKFKVIILTSDDSVMPGFLRSSAGGANDIVVQWNTSGHVNIITKQVKRVDLRSLAGLLRKSEAMMSNLSVTEDFEELSKPGRIKEIPEWYYDPATNSIQNGGINPRLVPATKISKKSMEEILRLGLEEKLWKPQTH